MSDVPTSPGPSDAADDDLAALPPSRRPKSPLVAIAVIALGAILIWHLRADVMFAFAGRTPTDLGDARSLQSRGVTLRDNSFVTIAGQPERRYALFVEPRGVRARETIFRLLGAGNGLFVRAGDTTGQTDLGERWSGRLRRFDALPWAESLRGYYAKETEVVRYLALDAIKAGRFDALRDRSGEPITLAADTALVVDVEYPHELDVYLSKDKYPSLADARHELDRMKLEPSGGQENTVEYIFHVPMPDARKNEIVEALSARNLVFQPRRERLKTTRAELRAEGDSLRIGRDTYPFTQVTAVGVPAPLTVGPDAFVLVADEAPGAFWWAPLLCVLLVAFAAFNVWYLVRSFRART